MKIWSVGASVLSFESLTGLCVREERFGLKKKTRTFTRNYWWCFNGWLSAARVGIWVWNPLKFQAGALGLCTWKAVLLPLNHCQKQDGSILGFPHGPGFVKSVCKGTALPSGSGNSALWLLLICIILVSALSAWAAVVCACFRNKWARFSNLCTNDVPQSDFSLFKLAGLRLCAGHLFSENASPFSPITGCIGTGVYFLPIKYSLELFICQWNLISRGYPARSSWEWRAQFSAAGTKPLVSHSAVSRSTQTWAKGLPWEEGKRKNEGRGLLLPKDLWWNSGY